MKAEVIENLIRAIGLAVCSGSNYRNGCWDVGKNLFFIALFLSVSALGLYGCLTINKPSRYVARQRRLRQDELEELEARTEATPVHAARYNEILRNQRLDAIYGNIRSIMQGIASLLMLIVGLLFAYTGISSFIQ